MTKPCSWCNQTPCTCQPMKTSEILNIFAQANRRCGYHEAARVLENAATVKEAEEVLNANNNT